MVKMQRKVTKEAIHRDKLNKIYQKRSNKASL